MVSGGYDDRDDGLKDGTVPRQGVGQRGVFLSLRVPLPRDIPGASQRGAAVLGEIRV